MNRSVLICVCLLAVLASGSVAAELPDSLRLASTSRIEFSLETDKDPSPFTWNFDSASHRNRSRVMFDLLAETSRFGSAYVKGAASWDTHVSREGEPLFKWEQGDYFYDHKTNDLAFEAVLFSNERRFFTGDKIAPLLSNDVIDKTDSNKGIRFEGWYDRTLGITSIFSLLEEGWEDTRKIAYIQTAFVKNYLQFSLSYLHETPPEASVSNHAVLKGELSGFYKIASVILSYEQSGFKKEGLFLPSGDFRLEDFNGSNFSQILPVDGAFFAEARIMTVPLGEKVMFDFVQRYFAVGNEYRNDLGMTDSERVGFVSSGYFSATDVCLNARLQYGRTSRTHMENKRNEMVEASVWGQLNGGIECVLRGMMNETEGMAGESSRQNHLHGAVNFHAKRMRQGVHFILRDLDTVFDTADFAWDSRINLNSDFSVDLRFILSDANITKDGIFARLEFRPTPRIFAYLSYGRQYLGDAPFLLEDDDLMLSHYGPSALTLYLRGDF